MLESIVSILPVNRIQLNKILHKLFLSLAYIPDIQVFCNQVVFRLSSR